MDRVGHGADMGDSVEASKIYGTKPGSCYKRASIVSMVGG